MPKVKPLTAGKLRASLPSEKVPYADSNELLERSQRGPVFPPQPRALKALELSVHISDHGYNVYLSGEPNLGRTNLVTSFLAPVSKKAAPPPDLVYVNNFNEPDQPKLIALPQGMGRELKNSLSQSVGKIRKEVPTRFEDEAYLKRRNALMDTFQSVRDELVGKMENEASEEGFNLDMDDQGSLTLYPLLEGKVLSEDEYERLDPTVRKKLKVRSERLMLGMADLLRRITLEERGLRENELVLDQEVMSEVVDEFLNPVAEKFKKTDVSERIAEFFKDMKKDMLDNIDHFAPKENLAIPGGLPAPDPFPGLLGGPPMPMENFFVRYEVNLFVDNKETQGAPVIIEDHPTIYNLLGCIERESEMGALVTDFTLIKAGALHRAHMGYVILQVEDMLQNAAAWEGLLRALRTGQARIEDFSDPHDQTKTKGIEPEPLELHTKVILIGDDNTYELLLAHEDRFPKLFKIKAHLQETVPRNAKSISNLLKCYSNIFRTSTLPVVSRDGLAALVDYSSLLAGDQQKLSLKFPLVRDILIESAAIAKMNKQETVDAATLKTAISQRDYRSNLYEEEFMEEYDRELIKVATSGEAVGRVNGLSVTWFGEYEFGLPHHIACTVGVGDGGIVDLEREAELGGPIHTKAMMILKSFLLGLFAQDKPLVLTGSLCFEQSYAHVEGDSASGAELAALLSALSGKPINQSLAFTGAVSQNGDIMAVGGVSRKIEGFFEVCRRRGLNGEQGVLLPKDNIRHLMLNDAVIQAVEQKEFNIYPITRIEEAMELLTGMPAGKRLASGRFAKGSLFHLVNERLKELGRQAEKALSRRRRSS